MTGNGYGLNNEDWRNSEDEDMLNTFVRLESGFMARQYDVMLAVEYLSSLLKVDSVASDKIEAFCCAIQGV